MSDSRLSAAQPAIPAVGSVSQSTLLENSTQTVALLLALVGHVESSATHLGKISGRLEATADTPLNVKLEPDTATQEKIDVAQEKIDSLDGRLQKTNQDAEELATRVNGLETSLDSLRSIQVDLDTKLKQIGARLDGLSDEIRKLSKRRGRA
jgi:chromosome segregation ATPase